MVEEKEVHVFAVGDRVLLRSIEFDENTTTAISPEDIETIRLHGYISRKYISIPVENLEYVGRRRCTRCKGTIIGEVFHFAGSIDEFYCLDCFMARFFVCNRCNKTFRLAEVNTHSGEKYCMICIQDLEKVYVNIMPPTKEDAESLIFSIYNVPFKGDVKETPYIRRCAIEFNVDDYGMYEIYSQVGELRYDFPIRVYGLMDRPEYQIKVDTKMDEKISDLLLKLFGDKKMRTEGHVGVVRELSIGFSYQIRQNERDKIVEFLRELNKIDYRPKEKSARVFSSKFQEEILKKLEGNACVV